MPTQGLCFFQGCRIKSQGFGGILCLLGHIAFVVKTLALQAQSVLSVELGIVNELLNTVFPPITMVDRSLFIGQAQLVNG